MLKKLMIALLALCLAALPALAEVRWSDVEAEVAAAGLEGRFVDVGTFPVKLWLPEVLRERPLEEPEVDEGYLAVYTNAGETAAVELQLVNLEDDTLSDYVDLMRGDGFTVTKQTINGLRCMRCDSAADDLRVYAFGTRGNGLFLVTCSPIGPKNLAWVWDAVGASIQRK